MVQSVTVARDVKRIIGKTINRSVMQFSASWHNNKRKWKERDNVMHS